MRRHQWVGFLLLIIGCAIMLRPWLQGHFREESTAGQCIPAADEAQQIKFSVFHSPQDNSQSHASFSTVQSVSQNSSRNPEQPRSDQDELSGQSHASIAAPAMTVDFSSARIRPAGPPGAQTTPAVAGISQRPDTPTSYIDYLTDRAMREAEAAAQKSAASFMKEILAPVEANDRSFAERLYTIGANARAVTKSEAAYREYVARRFYEEIASHSDLAGNLNAIAFEYLARLDRIAKQAMLDSGRDVTGIQPVTLTLSDFDGMFRSEIRACVDQTASNMQSQARQGAAVQAVSFGIGLLMPTTFIADLAIGTGIDVAGNSFRDPEGQVAIDAHHAAEKLAEHICFGTDQKSGLHDALLVVARYQNAQLKKTLAAKMDESGAADIKAVFGNGP